jgi:hypothetical protein
MRIVLARLPHKCHRLQFQQQVLISHGSGDWRSEIKVPVDLVSVGALFLACRLEPP